jgi:hypothetical protein
MKVTGGCHCGQITYEAEVDPAAVRVCHCTDCQKLTGTAFRTNISSLPGTFRLKTGTPKIYIKTAESGNKRAHGFCRSAEPRSTPPLLVLIRQPMGCGSVASTNERSLLHRPVKSGAVRRSLGRWTYGISRERSGSDG